MYDEAFFMKKYGPEVGYYVFLLTTCYEKSKLLNYQKGIFVIDDLLPLCKDDSLEKLMPKEAFDIALLLWDDKELTKLRNENAMQSGCINNDL